MKWKRKSFGKVYRAAKQLSRWQKILEKLLVCKRIFEHTYDQNYCWFLDNGNHGRSSQTCPRLFLFFCLLQSGKQQLWNYKQIVLQQIQQISSIKVKKKWIHLFILLHAWSPQNWCMHHIKVASFSFFKIKYMIVKLQTYIYKGGPHSYSRLISQNHAYHDDKEKCKILKSPLPWNREYNSKQKVLSFTSYK